MLVLAGATLIIGDLRAVVLDGFHPIGQAQSSTFLACITAAVFGEVMFLFVHMFAYATFDLSEDSIESTLFGRSTTINFREPFTVDAVMARGIKPSSSRPTRYKWIEIRQRTKVICIMPRDINPPEAADAAPDIIREAIRAQREAPGWLADMRAKFRIDRNRLDV